LRSSVNVGIAGVLLPQPLPGLLHLLPQQVVLSDFCLPGG